MSTEPDDKKARGQDTAPSKSAQGESFAKDAAKEAIRGAASSGFAGAAAGVGKAALKNRKTRWMLICSALAPFVAMGLLFTLAFGSMMGGSDANGVTNVSSRDAAGGDGVSVGSVSRLAEGVAATGTPWEVLAATAYHFNSGQMPDLSGDVAESPKTGTKNPGQPFGLVLDQANKIAEANGIEPLTEEDAEDFDNQILFLGLLLDARLSEHSDGDIPDLDHGAVINESPNGPENVREIGDGDREKQADQVEKIYLAAFKDLEKAVVPYKESADKVFELARQWRLGNSNCSATGAIVPSGTWISPMKGTASSSYGLRRHPITGVLKLHDGTDISAPGSPTIYAASAGTVTEVLNNNVAWGNSVLISHGGNVVTRYAHMTTGSVKVKVGMVVQAGTPLGTQGSTGYSTGPHLHFSTYVIGVPVDPIEFMRQRGVELGSDPVAGGEPTGGSTTVGGPDGGETIKSLTSTRADGAKVTLNAEQLANAKVIAQTGNGIGASEPGLVIALMTALQESSLRNLNHGDRDSLGLFQQRAGWGSATQRRDPVYATQAFFGGPEGPNKGNPPGLLDLDDWESLSPGVAAQKVQRSAYPDAYDKWLPVAREVLAAVGGGGVISSDNLGCASVGAAGPGAIRAISYNTCLQDSCDTAHPKRYSHARRIPDVVTYVQSFNADVIAVQEAGKDDRMKKLVAAMAPQYQTAEAFKGKVVFYKPNMLSTVDGSGEKLEKGGWTFDSGPFANRWASYQVFRHIPSGTKFIFVSVHTQPGDGQIAEAARVSYLQQMLDKIRAVRQRNPGINMMVAGDFNTYIPGKADRTKVAAYLNSKNLKPASTLLKEGVNGDSNSYNGWEKSVRTNSSWLDYVVLEPEKSEVRQRGVGVTKGEIPPSDHNPVWADVSLEGMAVGAGTVSGQPCAKGSSVEKGLKPNTISVYRAVCAQFPNIRSYGGVAPRGEHATGHSLDIMVKGAEGLKVRDWLRANYKQLGIDYLIYEQKIWSVQRSSEGWRKMEDRGSITANHYDHVHVSTTGWR